MDTSVVLNADKLFGILTQRIKTDPDLMVRVTTHIREKSGHNTIVNYHNNGATEEEKCLTYQECLKAILTSDFSALRQAKPVETIKAPPKAEDKPPETNNAAELIAQAIRLLQQNTGKAPVDADMVKNLVASETADLRKSLTAKVDDYLAKIPPRNVVEIVESGKVVREIGRQHYKFGLLVLAMQAKIPVLLVGPAGTGKSTAGFNAAKALNLEFEALSVGPQTSKGDLFGFIDANGNYRDTALVRRALQGGLFLADEIDAAHAGVLTGINMVLANGHIACPNGFHEKHAGFRFMAGANTYGNGANRVYVGRNQLDGATLDRFAIIDWPIDEGLEGALVGVEQNSPSLRLNEGGIMQPPDWLEFVRSVRSACDQLAIRHIVSPRAVQYGTALFELGVGRVHVEEMIIWKGMEKATREKVKGAL